MSTLLRALVRALRKGAEWMNPRTPPLPLPRGREFRTLSPRPPLPQAKEGKPDLLEAYFEGLRDAPVPTRLLAETSPEAFRRRLAANLAWAVVGAALALAVAALPPSTDPAAAARVASALAMREVRR